MAFLPSLKKIDITQELGVFASIYTECSGFNVNRNYYDENQVFAIYWRKRMIAGFVLGHGKTLRTLEVFVGTESRTAIYEHIKKTDLMHTEMCCFWIIPDLRKKTLFNFYVWYCVAFALWVYGSKQLIFGTNSARLAALYSAASRAKLIHIDFLNRKQTFVFSGPRKYCLLGVAQILWYKFKRIAKIAGKRRINQSSNFQHA